jgi:hypothetical protein
MSDDAENTRKAMETKAHEDHVKIRLEAVTGAKWRITNPDDEGRVYQTLLPVVNAQAAAYQLEEVLQIQPDKSVVTRQAKGRGNVLIPIDMIDDRNVRNLRDVDLKASFARDRGGIRTMLS